MKNKRKLIHVINCRVRNFLFVMKLTILAFFLGLMGLSASTYSQKTKLSLDLKNVTISEALKSIESQSEFVFIYENEALNLNKKVTIAVNESSIDFILSEILKDTGTSFKIVDKQVVITKSDPINILQHEKSKFEKESQQPNKKTVTGKVTDSRGISLPGAAVVVKGTTTGIITDFNGNFSLPITPDAEILVFSFIGMKSQEIPINGKTIFNVNFEDENIEIEEVVAVGYGVQKKKLVTGATIQVKGTEIEKMNSVSTLNALQGQTPGLSIIKVGSAPDADYKFNIRGQGTIGNSKPLVIIDGVIGGDLQSISPSDIESLDVLKDAASAAIYGSRAANGVILITTKHGKAGKVEISYDGNIGIQNVEKYMNMTNAQDFMMLYNEAQRNSSAIETNWSTELPSDVNNMLKNGWQGTNWWKLLTHKNAPVQNHAINITGGTEDIKFSGGVSYTDQDALMTGPNTENFKRYSFRLNSEAVILKKGNLDIAKVGENILYTYKKHQNRMYTTGDVMWNMCYPLLPEYNTDGTYDYNLSLFGNSTNNMVAYQDVYSQNEDNNHQLDLSVYLLLEPIKKLKFKSTFGYKLGAYTSRSFIPVFNFSTRFYQDPNKVSQSSNVGFSIQLDNVLTYDFILKEKHNFSFMLGQSMEKQGFGQSLNGSNLGSIFNTFEYAYLSNVKLTSNSTTLGGSPYNQWAIASFFGRVSYDYKQKYMVTGTMRADGSSNFSPGHQWGYFPSVSAGWAITNESFMEGTKNWLNFLKIRASWGKNGNQSIPNFQYTTPYSSNASYYFGTSKTVSQTGYYPTIIPNPDITWETSDQLDFGFDANFFNSHLSANLDFYNKQTKDWLVQAPILGSQGATAPYINGGDITNKGIEVNLNWNDHGGDLTYSINGNLSYNKNEVVRIANAQGIIEGQAVGNMGGGNLPPYRAQVGYPIGFFNGYETDGIFQNQAQIDAYKGAKALGVNTKPGDVIFVDRDGDGAITPNDRTMIGDPNPHVMVGLSLNLGYKGFDFAVMTNGVFGNQILTSYRRMDASSANYPEYLLGRWHGESTSNHFPRLTQTTNANFTNMSNIWLSDGDYLRISNVTLGYDFKKLFPRMILSQVRLYVTVQNLYTFSNYIGANPEVGAAPDNWAKGIDTNFNPSARTIMTGLNIKF